MVECKRVIIADAETILQRDLKEELTRHGYLVAAETADGVSAINLARQLRPDLVIMEIHLSGMDGIEAAADSKGSVHPQSLHSCRHRVTIEDRINPFHDIC